MTNVVGHPDPARLGARSTASRSSCTSPPTRSTARSSEGSWDEEQPLLPNSPYSASKAVQRPARPRLPPHPRAAGVHHALLEQLRPLPVPREGHPAVRHQPDRRRAGAALRRGRERPRLAARRRPLPRRSTWSSQGGRAGEVYNIGGGTELTNKELTGLLLEATGAGWDRVEQRRPTAGPRPALLGRHHQDQRRARLPAPGRLRPGARRHRRRGTARTAPGGSRSSVVGLSTDKATGLTLPDVTEAPRPWAGYGRRPVAPAPGRRDGGLLLGVAEHRCHLD